MSVSLLVVFLYFRAQIFQVMGSQGLLAEVFLPEVFLLGSEDFNPLKVESEGMLTAGVM